MIFFLEVCFLDFSREIKEKLNNYKVWDVLDFYWCRDGFMKIIFLLVCGLIRFFFGLENLERLF